MISAREAHRLMIKEEIELGLALDTIELKIRKACKNKENSCIIEKGEMTNIAYTTLLSEGYNINWFTANSNYEIYW